MRRQQSRFTRLLLMIAMAIALVLPTAVSTAQTSTDFMARRVLDDGTVLDENARALKAQVAQFVRQSTDADGNPITVTEERTIPRRVIGSGGRRLSDGSEIADTDPIPEGLADVTDALDETEARTVDYLYTTNRWTTRRAVLARVANKWGRTLPDETGVKSFVDEFNDLTWSDRIRLGDWGPATAEGLAQADIEGGTPMATTLVNRGLAPTLSVANGLLCRESGGTPTFDEDGNYLACR